MSHTDPPGRPPGRQSPPAANRGASNVVGDDLHSMHRIADRQAKGRRQRVRRDLARIAERYDQLDPEVAALARWLGEVA